MRTLLSKVFDSLKEPVNAIMFFSRNGLMKWMPDRIYIKLVYKLKMHKPLNLDNPATFTEKLQWLKLNDHNPDYKIMVDKAAVKDYVAKIIGREYIIPTLGKWDNVDEIDFDSLPDKFVLKVNHDSGGVVVCHDKGSFDIDAAKKKLRKCLRNNGYWYGREWPYKDIKPCIIAERYMESSRLDNFQPAEQSLADYKYYCFNGIPRMMYISNYRMSSEKQTEYDFFDMDFNHLDFCENDEINASVPPKKPINFEKMKDLAMILSTGLPHVRCDFYEVNGRVYFGELTLYSDSGFLRFRPEKWDHIVGEWLTLPKFVQ